MDETSKLPPPDQPLVPPTALNNLAGSTFGGYRIVRKLAQGGMGVIYEAIQVKLDRKVALKILTEPLAGRPEFFQRFEREAKAAAALNHPNVVQVHDFGEAEGRHFIIMEFVEGQNLSAYVAVRGPLPVAEALDIIEQAAGALKAAAAKAIVHRDIKPSNLMLTRNGIVKVADLGLARIINQDSDLTMSNIVGSPHFIAPEQAADSRIVDHRVDIYSLGLTLFFLVTGKYPYDGNSPISIVLAHSQKPLPTAAEFGIQLPAEVEALIGRMSAKEAGDRYQDYDSLLADLRRVRAGQAPVAVPTPAAFAPSPVVATTAPVTPVPMPTPLPTPLPGSVPSRKEWIIGIAVLAFVIIFAAVCIILVLGHQRSARPMAGNQPYGQEPNANPGMPNPPDENRGPQPGMQNNPEQGGNTPPLLMLIGPMDANHDRILGPNEIANATTFLKSLDRNGDGKLEPDEYLASSDLASGQYKQFRFYKALHADANGVIGSAEIANAPAELKKLDLNGNGQLDPQEIGPEGGPPPGGNGGPNGMNGPPNGPRNGPANGGAGGQPDGPPNGVRPGPPQE